MTSFNPGKIFREIDCVVKSHVSVAEGFQAILRLCEVARPHPDWPSFRALDLDGDLHHLEEWLQSLLRTSPPPASVTGLWFGLFNPVVQGRTTADLHLIGAPYSADDPDWLFQQRWGEDTAIAGSSVLDAIYRVAYDRKGGLGNDAEYTLCLAYAALAVRHLARTLGPVILGDAAQRVLTVGFNDGDFLCIGAVRRQGLVFSREHGKMA